MKLTCAIIDDEPLAIELLASYVRKTPDLELLATYGSAVEAMSGLRETSVNLVFLDIQMPELSGLELSHMLDLSESRIVFTTAFSQYAVDGYKVGAIDYLLKPISYPDFVGAVSRASKWFELKAAASASNRESQLDGVGEAGSSSATLVADVASGVKDDYMFVKSDYKLLRINFADILYVEGLKDYVKIYLAGTTKPVLSLTAMRTIEATLPAKDFLRIHRSFIVNMNHVTVFERGQILFGEKRLPVSDSYKPAVNDYINAHLLQGR